MERKLDRIYIHCTAAMYGTLEGITKFHTALPPAGRGWAAIGYHYLLTNPYPSLEEIIEDDPQFDTDGKIWSGRGLEFAGAHVGKLRAPNGTIIPGDNATSIGIALVGGDQGPAGRHELERKYGAIPLLLPWWPFTDNQLKALIELTVQLQERFSIPTDMVKGHSEHPSGKAQGKTCPDLNMDILRKSLDHWQMTGEFKWT